MKISNLAAKGVKQVPKKKKTSGTMASKKDVQKFEKSAYSFEVGMTVMIRGLAAQPQYNNTKATILAWNVAGNGWKCMCQLDGATKVFFEANLVPES